jgi:hypothetical protein
MKKIILVLFFYISAFSQNEINLYPAEIRKIQTEFTKEYIENYTDEFGGNPWSKPFQGCSWYCGGRIDQIKSSTECKSVDKEKNISENIHDADYGTCWINKNQDSLKIIEFVFNKESAKFTEIVIVNGNVKSDSLWREYSRAKKIKMYLNDAEYKILNLEDNKNEQIFKLEPVGAKTKPKSKNKNKQWVVKFEIIEIYKGKRENIAISEIYFDGNGHENE